ncbi:MAG: class I tRNA ligase family protein, partial [Verrucomicrobia bacterium]|nr:class I tRNA ligase family protein [Verrucomicrobiota bacterium]
LWVSSVDWQNEVPFGEDLFKQTAEPYRRFRNTLRILLANLHDFDAPKDAVADAEFSLIDRWILERLHQVVVECREAYASYEFRKVFNTLNQFCTVDLSALYIDITKDRLYCDAAASPRRRATQTAMHRVFEALVKLLAPVLSFTADEAWEHAGKTESVHLELFPEPESGYAGTAASDQIAQLSRLRDLAQVAIDAAVKADEFKKRECAAVVFHLPVDDPARAVLAESAGEALEFLMVSSFTLSEAAGEPKAAVSVTNHAECPRCRRSLLLVTSGLCQRCEEVVADHKPISS